MYFFNIISLVLKERIVVLQGGVKAKDGKGRWHVDMATIKICMDVIKYFL